MSLKRHKRCKLLLDEGLHIANTKNKGKSDKFIFQLAEQEGRLPVVFNTKHFKPLITKNSMSVIALSTNLTDKGADMKICKVLRDMSKAQFKGCLISISKSSTVIKYL